MWIVDEKQQAKIDGFTLKVGRVRVQSLHPNAYPKGGEISVDLDNKKFSDGFKLSDMGWSLMVNVEILDELIAALAAAKVKIDGR